MIDFDIKKFINFKLNNKIWSNSLCKGWKNRNFFIDDSKSGYNL
jgi:hypothetical protein